MYGIRCETLAGDDSWILSMGEQMAPRPAFGAVIIIVKHVT